MIAIEHDTCLIDVNFGYIVIQLNAPDNDNFNWKRYKSSKKVFNHEMVLSMA